MIVRRLFHARAQVIRSKLGLKGINKIASRGIGRDLPQRGDTHTELEHKFAL